jgi:hypothetical protein
MPLRLSSQRSQLLIAVAGLPPPLRCVDLFTSLFGTLCLHGPSAPCLFHLLQVRAYLADFSSATDVTGLYGGDPLKFDSLSKQLLTDSRPACLAMYPPAHPPAACILTANESAAWSTHASEMVGNCCSVAWPEPIQPPLLQNGLHNEAAPCFACRASGQS